MAVDRIADLWGTRTQKLQALNADARLPLQPVALAAPHFFFVPGDTDADVIQTLVGYQWLVGATMLELFYFSAQHGELVYRTISLDYKAL